jgi:hypothetical protein
MHSGWQNRWPKDFSCSVFYEVNMHSGWQNRWPKDFSSGVIQRNEHAQRMAEPLAEGFLVRRDPAK